ncbi:hypothetical protein [Paenarthrobacter sp. A20]|uniref:hypothetical protein n=1 Tax=Paenarthrobacter sp. A20 TaxID=2817891 RepID=UPI00209CAF5E|nr:hypothetical protein [Paenarthrobacter sp. A20]MCP1413932.1 lysylphosphatidylglycerol synthetase-like protein (DUF2156 family) [Paenarthrobacter sp. A20]
MDETLSHAAPPATARNLCRPRPAAALPIKRAEVLGRHARWTAAAASVGIAAHLGMVSAGDWMITMGLCMAFVCVPCAWVMWRAPSLRTARMLVGMSLAMALLHVALVLGATSPTGHAHAGAEPLSEVVAAHSPHVLPALGVVGADFIVAWLSASWLRRAGSLTPEIHRNQDACLNLVPEPHQAPS